MHSKMTSLVDSMMTHLGAQKQQYKVELLYAQAKGTLTLVSELFGGKQMDFHKDISKIL